MRNVHSGAGPKPNTGPLPMSKGLIYSDPFPGGGICFTSKQKIYKLEGQTCLLNKNIELLMQHRCRTSTVRQLPSAC